MCVCVCVCVYIYIYIYIYTYTHEELSHTYNYGHIRDYGAYRSIVIAREKDEDANSQVHVKIEMGGP